MAEYLIQTETLDDIANAINAKTGGSSAMTPAEMVTEIAAIPSGGGGGGSLPSVISRIDGGNFTPASDQQASAYDIAHSLGVAPKGFAIWTEDAVSGTVAIRYAANAFLAVSDVTRSNDTNYAAIGAASILYNGNTSTASATLTSAQVSGYMDSAAVRWNNNVVFYKAGLTYKWIAWA